MNRSVIFLTLALTPGILYGQNPPDKATLEKVSSAWATLDPSKAAPFYAKDPGLAFFDIAPRSYRGWSEYEKGTREMTKTMKSMSFKINDAVVHTAGNTAWATSLVDAEVVNKDGTHEKIGARWTLIWEKRGNDWLIVHEHYSAPLPEPPPKPAAAKKK